MARITLDAFIEAFAAYLVKRGQNPTSGTVSTASSCSSKAMPGRTSGDPTRTGDVPS
jgi:hypothetical protein